MSFRLLTIFALVFILLTSAFRWESYAGSDGLSLPIETKISKIAIDPGFGGKDLGAPSCKEGIYAKQINLEIAKNLADKIKDELNVDIIMTRTEDNFVSLEQRTSLANLENADLYISIHCNAHEDPMVHGIETYFLDMATDKKAVEIAARENATSDKNIDDLHNILTNLMLNTKINESQYLAEQVQNYLCNHMKTKYKDIKNGGIKRAPFYVLIGAEMPSILIEVSYLSNPKECERLLSKGYQDDLVTGILMGIESYIDSTTNSDLK